MKIDYQECLLFIKNNLNITLLPYQEALVKLLLDGYEVRTCRGSGRSFVAHLIGKYVEHKLAKNNYGVVPDITFTYGCPVKEGLLKEATVRYAKGTCNEAQFAQEYLCEYRPPFNIPDDV